MFWNRIFATKSLEMLDAEAKGDNRLRRRAGPDRADFARRRSDHRRRYFRDDRARRRRGCRTRRLSSPSSSLASPAPWRRFCYAEFSSMAPVAGSAYTYAYATLGEIFAWIIGWDLILEYAMSGATVAASWSKYLNEFLEVWIGRDYRVPDWLCHDPFSTPGAVMNLPAMVIMVVVTIVLVIGIRENAASNTVLVGVKLGVVLFVIAVGVFFINPANWTGIPADERRQPEEQLIPELVR